MTLNQLSGNLTFPENSRAQILYLRITRRREFRARRVELHSSEYVTPMTTGDIDSTKDKKKRKAMHCETKEEISKERAHRRCACNAS